LSTNEPESLSEREFAAELEGKMSALLGGTPRSPGEAVRVTDQIPEADTPEIEPQVVEDAPPAAPETPAPQIPEAPEEGEEPTPSEEDEDYVGEGLAWAKRKYGDEVTLEQLANVAHNQEQALSRQGAKVREAEQLGYQWYEYSQNLERQLSQQPTGMPMSASEEQWVENAMTNPLAAAAQAKGTGNEALYQAVIARVAQENPLAAGQIASQVEMAFMEQQRQAAYAAATQQNGQSAETMIDASVKRLGIDLQAYGQPMMAKIGELGEYHPYTQAILYGSDQERDLAFQAVYDLVREGRVTRRVVRDSEREAQIAKEGELRRQAAGVLTGTPNRRTPPPTSPFMAAMTEEWRRAGQWHDE